MCTSRHIHTGTRIFRVRSIAVDGLSQDAWGRVVLRASGALALLVKRLAATSDDEEKTAIVAALRLVDRVFLFLKKK